MSTSPAMCSSSRPSWTKPRSAQRDTLLLSLLALKPRRYISEKIGAKEGSKPVSFVFHGGSGSDLKDIREAVGYGVIKMNIDTDTQWSYWSGIKSFEVGTHRAHIQHSTCRKRDNPCTGPHRKLVEPAPEAAPHLSGRTRTHEPRTRTHYEGM